jgi:glycosyltransferase involved in cell wall biosynthesis
MKINLIIFISEFNHGGAGNSIFRLCKGLSKKKYNINVICLNDCSYEKHLKKNNIKLFKIKAKKTFFAMFKVKKIVNNLLSTKYKKSIFVSNIHYTNILSILFLRRLKMKMVLIERTPHQELNIFFNTLDMFKKIIIKFFIKFLYRYADLCISNSSYISNEYNKKYNLKFKTIFPPSFIKNEKIVKKSKKNIKQFTFGTVCRLTREKGLYEFISSISKLKFNFKFLIIGDGPEKKALKKLAIKLNIKNKIVFYGFQNYLQIKNKLKNMNLFINCSYFEGFPNSVVESLSNGKQVLASQSFGGINEIIKNKNFGKIYKNENELLKILGDFNSQKKVNINRKEINSHLNKFSVSENIKKYSYIFENFFN